MTKCTKCDDSYYEENDLCYLCPIGCTECDSATKCKKCDDGYYQENDSCLLCSDSLDFCIECDKSDECDTCKTGFMIDSGTKQCICPSTLFADYVTETCVLCSTKYLNC